MIEVMLPCGREVLVQGPREAAELRRRIDALEVRSERISTELRRSLMLPRGHRNQQSGWLPVATDIRARAILRRTTAAV